MKNGFMYLTAIIEWYSHLIVGYTLSNTLEKASVIETVKKAMARYENPIFSIAIKERNLPVSMIRIAIPETYAYNSKAFDEYSGSRQIMTSSWPIEYRLAWNIFDYTKMCMNPGRIPAKPCDHPNNQTCILADGNMVFCCRDCSDNSFNKFDCE